MTQYQSSPPSTAGDDGQAVDFLARAKSLAPLIEKEAVRIEENATLTPAVVRALRDTELFWFMVPDELGGGGADARTSIEVIEELTRADGSTGWTIMANATVTGVAGAFIGDDGVETLFGGGKLPILAGMNSPSGTAVEVDGGFRGSGNYQFASGCEHADWISAGVLVMENGKPRHLPDGLPDVRLIFVPREQVEFRGNWDVIGLVGTGSFDYHLPEQFVPAGLSMERNAEMPWRGGPLFRFGLTGLAGLDHAAVALGLMKRALQEIARLASEKKRLGYAVTVSGHPIFQDGFMKHEALYQATRAFVMEVFTGAEKTAAAGQPITDLDRARFRQVGTWATQVAADVVQFCHMCGASEAIRRPTVLGRCLQDTYTATQHMFIDAATLSAAAPAVIKAWIDDEN